MNVRLSAVRTSRVTRRLQPRDEIFLCRPVPWRPFHKLLRRLRLPDFLASASGHPRLRLASDNAIASVFAVMRGCYIHRAGY
jgi:tRNA G46 methylase TrmB